MVDQTYIEMLSGIPPFYSENSNEMYRMILYDPLSFDEGEFTPGAKAFCEKLLERDPANRLGSGPEDAEEIKRHPFFVDIDWFKFSKRQVQPVYRPNIHSETDTSNFDPEFTESMVVDESLSSVNMLSDSLQEKFKGFTYTDDSSVLGTSKVGSVKLDGLKRSKRLSGAWQANQTGQ